MKEKTKGIIIGVLATASIATFVNAAAEEIYKTVSVIYNDIKICIDGTYLEPKDVNGNTVEPFILDGTTYLPVRAVAGAFNKAVDWDGATNTVYLGAKPGASGYSRTNPAPIGTTQTVRIDNYSEKYTAAVTVTEVIRGEKAWKMIKEANSFNDAPEDGMEYVLMRASVTVSDVADDAKISLYSGSFDFYSSDYSKYSSVWVIEPNPGFDGEAYSGGTIEGYVCGQVKIGDATPSVYFGTNKDGAWFSLTK